MSPAPKKKSPTKNAGGDLIAQLGPTVQAKLIEALQDPVVQAKLKEKGQQALDALKKWRTEKEPDVDEPTDASALWVFHQRLVRRERRIRATVDELTKIDAQLGSALAPVVSALDDTAKSLKVAQALPFKNRRKAHKAIDSALDEVEDQLLAAGLGLAVGDKGGS